MTQKSVRTLFLCRCVKRKEYIAVVTISHIFQERDTRNKNNFEEMGKRGKNESGFPLLSFPGRATSHVKKKPGQEQKNPLKMPSQFWTVRVEKNASQQGLKRSMWLLHVSVFMQQETDKTKLSCRPPCPREKKVVFISRRRRRRQEKGRRKSCYHRQRGSSHFLCKIMKKKAFI